MTLRSSTCRPHRGQDAVAMDIRGIDRCNDLRDEHIQIAVRSAEGMRGLLHHLCQVAAPNEGAPKVLRALARLASGCEWIEGELGIEIEGNEHATSVSVLSGLGGGLWERVLPVATFLVPVDEFFRAVELVPKLVAPLVIAEVTDHSLSLRCQEATESIRLHRSPSDAPGRIRRSSEAPTERVPDMRSVDPDIVPPSAYTRPTIPSMDAVRIAQKLEEIEE